MCHPKLDHADISQEKPLKGGSKLEAENRVEDSKLYNIMKKKRSFNDRFVD